MKPQIRSVAIAVAVVIAAGCAKKVVETPSPPPPVRETPISNQQIVDELRVLAFDATETIQGVVVNLPNVYLFAFGSSDLAAEARGKLRELAAYLNRPQLTPRRITVGGHTDSVGTDESNQELSERRAAVVQQELLAGQVMSQRVTAVGYGESRPVASNSRADGADDPEGRARNRRVEILIENAP